MFVGVILTNSQNGSCILARGNCVGSAYPSRMFTGLAPPPAYPHMAAGAIMYPGTQPGERPDCVVAGLP